MKKVVKTILSPKTIITKLIIAAVVLLIIFADRAGYLDSTVAFLESDHLTFQVGEMTFNAFEIVKKAAILIVLTWIAIYLSGLGERYILRIKRLGASNRALLKKAYQALVFFIFFLIALDMIGIDLTALTVFSGALGIGLGFGLQKVASNFISGIILLFEKSVEQGDIVELDDGLMGYVKLTSARHTLVETFDGKEVMIPNEDFITTRVINWTYSNTKGRIEIPIGVSYGCDIEKAQELILEAAVEHPRCSEDPEPECYLREFGDSSVNFLLMFWVDDIIKGRYIPQSEVMMLIWKKFKENDIEIPFPQRDLHIKNPLDIELKEKAK